MGQGAKGKSAKGTLVTLLTIILFINTPLLSMQAYNPRSSENGFDVENRLIETPPRGVAGLIDGSSYVQALRDHFVYERKIFKVKGFNYYPRDYSWKKMWTEWHPEVVDYELNLAEGLDLNVVRAFIHWDTFGGEDVNITLVERLGEFLDLADRHGFKVIFTLLDFIDWEVIDAQKSWRAKSHLEGIVQRYADDPRIFAWNLQNEPDLSWTVCGKQGYGWCDEGNWLRFLESMAQTIRSLDQNHLITVGLFDPHKISLVESFVDYVSFHYYNPESQLSGVISDVKGITEKPIVIEEYGLHTWPDRPGDPHDEEDQKRYYEATLRTIKEEDIAGCLFWSLLDHPVGTTFEDGETHNNHMGVFRCDYTEKPSASIVRDFNLQKNPGKGSHK